MRTSDILWMGTAIPQPGTGGIPQPLVNHSEIEGATNHEQESSRGFRALRAERLA
jgi:hypothetical protein